MSPTVERSTHVLDLCEVPKLGRKISYLVRIFLPRGGKLWICNARGSSDPIGGYGDAGRDTMSATPLLQFTVTLTPDQRRRKNIPPSIFVYPVVSSVVFDEEFHFQIK